MAGGFERVTDYPKAIEDCLAELNKVRMPWLMKRN